MGITHLKYAIPTPALFRQCIYARGYLFTADLEGVPVCVPLIFFSKVVVTPFPRVFSHAVSVDSRGPSWISSCASVSLVSHTLFQRATFAFSHKDAGSIQVFCLFNYSGRTDNYRLHFCVWVQIFSRGPTGRSDSRGRVSTVIIGALVCIVYKFVKGSRKNVEIMPHYSITVLHNWFEILSSNFSSALFEPLLSRFGHSENTHLLFLFSNMKYLKSTL